MSYISSNLYEINASPSGVKQWLYLTTDSFSTVSGASYFADGYLRGLRPGDLILVNVYSAVSTNQFSGFRSQTHAVVSSASGNAVTAAATTFVGDTGSGGTAGLVPAPPAGSAAAGMVVAAAIVGPWYARESVPAVAALTAADRVQ